MHLTIWEIVPLVALRVLRLLPSWLREVLTTLEAIERFRRKRGRGRARSV